MRIPGVFIGLPAWTLVEFGDKKKRPGGRVGYFSLYFYFINLAGVKRTFFGKYIWLRISGLGEFWRFWGLDKVFGKLARARGKPGSSLLRLRRRAPE